MKTELTASITLNLRINGETWAQDIQINDNAQTPQEQKEPKVAVDANGNLFKQISL